MNLNNVTFASGDATEIEARLNELFEAIRRAGSDPSYRIEDDLARQEEHATEAALLAQVNTDIDLTGKGNLLWYAGEETIEHLGYLYGARGTRLPAQPAQTTLRFTLSETNTVASIIPAGIRVSDDAIVFATDRELVIHAGKLTGEVSATCTEGGEHANGIAAGRISDIVDRLPFLESAENITETAGGADIEDLESYRQRLRLVPESFSVAGPTGAYIFWAKTANANIADVAAWMPPLDPAIFAAFVGEITGQAVTDEDALTWRDRYNELVIESGTGPGNVNVAVLMAGGEIPSDEVIEQVHATLSPRTRRPLTDFVHVLKPRTQEFSIDFTYWIRTEDAAQAPDIQRAVDAAVRDYITWQTARLGRSINPSQFTKMLMAAGIKGTRITQPTFRLMEHDEVAQLTGEPRIDYGGLSNG